MKRIGVLLVAFVVLAWIGSKLVPHAGPPLSSVKSRVAVPTSAPAPKAEPPETDRPQTAAENKSQQERLFGAKTIVAAERAIKDSLSDPDSVQFKDVYANYTVKFGVVACGQVNAKNKMGGYAGFKRFASAGRSVILEGQDKLVEAWTEACL